MLETTEEDDIVRNYTKALAYACMYDEIVEYTWTWDTTMWGRVMKD